MAITSEQKEEIKRLIAKARQHVMDEREYAEQRKAWAKGQMMKEAIDSVRNTDAI